MASSAVGKQYVNAGEVLRQQSFGATGGMLDAAMVQKQKERALKELESRVKLAHSQHERMYEIQKRHIIEEHDRQTALVKSTIERDRDITVMGMEAEYQKQVREIEKNYFNERINVFQQADGLEIQCMQQAMGREHAERERIWNHGYYLSAVPSAHNSSH
jgi:hypothetical protein